MGPALGQEPASEPDTVIQAEAGDGPSDDAIQVRIFAEIDALASVSVAVRDGVVTLTGPVANDAAAQRAVRLASRLEGVVTVEDDIERTLAVGDNLAPLLDDSRDALGRLRRALPLLGIAAVVVGVIVLVGHRLAAWAGLWQRVMPNGFLAELVSSAVRVAAWLIAAVVALNLLGAKALMGTLLGGAGVLGLAVGFAVRDTQENYIASILRSLRQPFRANDFVVIDQHEGVVVRLTSRATVLMTLDGNHLRIPNATVFKAVILNYTRNPQRRFTFDLGVDANDDPVDAMRVGLDAVRGLPFVLDEPSPVAVVDAVGDSNIGLKFFAWVDQTQASFGKSRSLAIRAAKDALEAGGFTLPEPIYRLRFDGVPGTLGVTTSDGSGAGTGTGRGTASERREPADRGPTAGGAGGAESEAMDVTPEDDLQERVAAERAEAGEDDLLDADRPME